MLKEGREHAAIVDAGHRAWADSNSRLRNSMLAMLSHAGLWINKIPALGSILDRSNTKKPRCSPGLAVGEFGWWGVRTWRKGILDLVHDFQSLPIY